MSVTWVLNKGIAQCTELTDGRLCTDVNNPSKNM